MLRYSREHGVEFSPDDEEDDGDGAGGTLLDRLVSLGFLRVHVQEALQYTRSR